MLERGIDALVREFRENGSQPSSRFSIEERRTGYIESASLGGDAEEVESLIEADLCGIPVRFYSRVRGEGKPLAVYFHGGCFISGGFETHDRQMRQLANRSDATVALIDYRIAPEHSFPAAHEDCLTAVEELYRRAGAFGIDPEKISFVGDSAGANLALSTALTLRDKGEPLPRRLILIYPMADPTGHFPSIKENGYDYVMTKDAFSSGWEHYLNSSDEKHDPRVALTERKDLEDLPETHIVTAEYDPLRDEGEALFRNLRQAEVEASCTRYLGTIHGFFQLSGVSGSARRLVSSVAELLK